MPPRRRNAETRPTPRHQWKPSLTVLEDRAVPATITVNTILDDNTPNNGLLSLREALAAANRDNAGLPADSDVVGATVGPFGVDTIRFAANVTGTSYLANGTLTISNPVTIAGPGAGLLKLSGFTAAPGGVGGPTPTQNRVLDVAIGAVTIQDITIQDGLVNSGRGGAIRNLGSLTISRVLFDNNRGQSGSPASPANASFGAAISNGVVGDLTVNDSGFTNGFASNTLGTDIYSDSAGVVAVTNSSLTGQFMNGSGVPFTGGNSLVTTAGTLRVVNSFVGGIAVSGGTADLRYVTAAAIQTTRTSPLLPTEGYGLYVSGTGAVTLTSSIVSGNTVTVSGAATATPADVGVEATATLTQTANQIGTLNGAVVGSTQPGIRFRSLPVSPTLSLAFAIPLPGSPALGVGLTPGVTPLSDIRGTPRPAGGPIDAGQAQVQAPGTVGEAYTTPFGATLTRPAATGVLQNDANDPDYAAIASATPSVALVAQLVTNIPAAAGSVALNGDGSFTFTPAASFGGATSFTYTVTNGARTSAPVTASITVGAAPPAAALVLTLTNASPTTDNTPTLSGTVSSANPTDITLTITGLGVALPPFPVAANASTYSATIPTDAPAALRALLPPLFRDSLPDGTYTVTAVGSDRVTRAVSNTATLTFVINTAAPPVVAQTRTFVVGGGAGAGPRVRAFDEAGATKLDFFAFDPTFLGGVRVAQGDLNGDGIDDIVAATGPGVESRVKAFDGKTGAELASFLAYEPGYTNGVFVAVGDVSGDGKPDIVTGTSSGGAARVRVFEVAKAYAQLEGDAGNFFVYDPGFRGGVRVAVGDITSDGVADIVTGAGISGGPHVQGYTVKGGTRTQVANFFAYDTAFRGGIFVAVTAAGQIVTGPDGLPDSAGTIVSQLFAGLPNTTGGLSKRSSTDADLTTAPEVRVFDSRGTTVATTRPFADTFANGVRVSAGTGSDGATLIYAAAGETGGSRVKVYRLSAAGLAQVGGDVLAFEDTFLGSVYVGGTTRPVSR